MRMVCRSGMPDRCSKAKDSDGNTYPIITWEVAGKSDGYTFEGNSKKNPSVIDNA